MRTSRMYRDGKAATLWQQIRGRGEERHTELTGTHTDTHTYTALAYADQEGQPSHMQAHKQTKVGFIPPFIMEDQVKFSL